jgi:hypothetical protein
MVQEEKRIQDTKHEVRCYNETVLAREGQSKGRNVCWDARSVRGTRILEMARLQLPPTEFLIGF